MMQRIWNAAIETYIKSWSPLTLEAWRHREETASAWTAPVCSLRGAGVLVTLGKGA